MPKLTCAVHGDAANELMSYYVDEAKRLEASGHFFMAAIALAFSVETAVLVYLLVEFGEDNGGELQIPASVGFFDLIEAANEIDVLNAPIDYPSHVRDDNTRPKYLAKDAVEKIRLFRNLIHPGRALESAYDPRTFTKEKLDELFEMADSVMHSLMYYL